MAKDSITVNVQGNSGTKPRLYAYGGVADDTEKGVKQLRLSGAVNLYVDAISCIGSVCYSKFWEGGLVDLIANVTWQGIKSKFALTATSGSVHIRVISLAGVLLYEWFGVPGDFDQSWERILISAGLLATVGDGTLPAVQDDNPVDGPVS